MKFLVFTILGVVVTETAKATCIGVLSTDQELPTHVVTSHNTGLTYDYDLENGEYFLSWHKKGITGGPFGPFSMGTNCMPPKLVDESDEFLIFQKGCGTFCWYAHIFSLPAAGGSSVGDNEIIDRPLSLDLDNYLLAYYHSKDVIRVRNLHTAYEQEIRTVLKCDTPSGLCIGDVQINEKHLQYTWRYEPPEQTFYVSLDDELLGK